MKPLLLFASLGLLLAAKAQQFQNLDFEQGSTPPNYTGTAAERLQILPGWTTYYRPSGGVEDNPSAYPLLGRGIGDSFCIGSPCIDVGSSLAFHGRYGLRIDSGTGGGESGIRQTGLIPADAHTLTLRAGGYGAGLIVRIDGQPLDIVVVGGDATQMTLAADVTPFAGQSHMLTVAARLYQIDDLRFTPVVAVPLKPVLELVQIARDRHLYVFTGVLQIADAADGPYRDIGAGIGRQECCVEPFDFRVLSTFFRVRN